MNNNNFIGSNSEEENISGYIGRTFDLEGDNSLGEDVYFDLNEPHMITICGKRGYGKSYTLGVFAEELMSLKHNLRKNMATVIIDAMGAYWSLQEQNKNGELLDEWGLNPEGFPVTVYYPNGLEDKYGEHPDYFHKGFKLYPSELSVSDWLFLLDIKETQAQAGALGNIIENAEEQYGKFYGLDDLLDQLEKSEVNENVQEALNRKLKKAQSWGIFSEEGNEIEDIVKGEEFVVLDLSGAGELPWNVRTTLTAILSRKLYSKRAFARSEEEIAKVRDKSFDASFPLVWLFIDEAHLFAPSGGKTSATDPLIEWVRQGRRPGLSIVLATQQPGSLDHRILSQCDTLIIHRLTAGKDSDAVGEKISEIHDSNSIRHYMKNLPEEPGYSIIMNDKTEEIVPVKIRPRKSWHGGGSAKLDEFLD
ncbi:MAG: ATP-binding protein [Candidatus Nanohaloarchaea archaeon]